MRDEGNWDDTRSAQASQRFTHSGIEQLKKVDSVC
jgi:hypothetical protein